MLSSFHGPDSVTSPTSPTTLVPRVGVTYPQWAKPTKCALDFLKHWGQVLYTLISLPNTKCNAWCWKMPHKHWMNEWMNAIPLYIWPWLKCYSKVLQLLQLEAESWPPCCDEFFSWRNSWALRSKASVIPSCEAVLLWDSLVQTLIIQGRERARLGWSLREGLYSRERELLSPRHCLSKEWSLQDIMICTLLERVGLEPSQLVSICTGVTFSDMRIHM